MDQLKSLNGPNSAYYNDKYGHNQPGFRVNPEDGYSLSEYYRYKAQQEASVAKNLDDNEWRFLCVVVAIPLA